MRASSVTPPIFLFNVALCLSCVVTVLWTLPMACPLLDDKYALMKVDLLASQERSKPVGTLNGINIYYVDHPPQPKVHCVGENFDEKESWLFRSCEYSNLCIDIDKKEFVFFQDGLLTLSYPWFSSTQVYRNQHVVAGGSQPRDWFRKNGKVVNVGQFQPKVTDEEPPSGYYRIKATMLPFYRHPTSWRNPGHLLWDDFMPLYTLLDMFDRENDHLLLAHLRRRPSDEFKESVPETDIMGKFLPLMGETTSHLNFDEDFDLDLYHSDHSRRRRSGRRLVCPDHSITGGGSHADHGTNHWHGQQRPDYKQPNNSGKGGFFRRYRRFLMKNIGVDPDTRMDKHYRIVVSQNSSSKMYRANNTFAYHINGLKKSLGDRADIVPVELSSLTLREQVDLMSTTAVFISVVGGGASTAMFLPKGAHVILYYLPYHSYLDYDFWNQFPHLNIHWVPHFRIRKDERKEQHVKSLIKLISKELDALDAEIS